MKLCLEDLKKKDLWEKAGIRLPQFDIEAMKKATEKGCRWVHFGAGNIFRGFPAARMQDLLEAGLANTGIVVGEGFDHQIIDDIYVPYDNLCLMATLKSDQTVDLRVVASIAKAYKTSTQLKAEWEALKEVFRNPALHMQLSPVMFRPTLREARKTAQQ